jgi:hypothetical protein
MRAEAGKQVGYRTQTETGGTARYAQRQLSADEATHAQDPDERSHGDRVDVIAIMGSLKWWQSVLLNLLV